MFWGYETKVCFSRFYHELFYDSNITGLQLYSSSTLEELEIDVDGEYFITVAAS